MIGRLFLLLLAVGISLHRCDPIDDYVWRPDSNYGWKDMGPDYVMKGVGFVNRSIGWTGYTLNMTSQRWLTDADFAVGTPAGSIWWHILVVIVPDNVVYKNNGSLYITGCSVNSAIPDASWEDIRVAAALATSANMVIGALFQVPNENVIFAADPLQKSRGEDAITAYTWDHFLKDPSQPEWLTYFPMVKASLRAMDTITDFMKTKFPEQGTQLDYYSVTGASKRGWTTWLCAVVDPNRVRAIAPIVLDLINFVPLEHHQYRSYGGWTWALHDYTEMKIMSRIDDPNIALLAANIDPYYFKERLTVPKLVVNAVLDEFQQPDDTRYWWSEMPGPKHFLMTPNAEHSEATGIFMIVPAIAQWIKTVVDNDPVPEFTWTIDSKSGEIVATLNEVGVVHEAKVWWGYSCGTNPDGLQRRDFRMASLDAPCTCGVEQDGRCANLKSFWQHQVLNATVERGRRTYRALVQPPADGRWVAFFIDISYGVGPHEKGPDIIPKDLAMRLEFTTEVSVLPMSFPYAGCGIDNPAVPCTDNIL